MDPLQRDAPHVLDARSRPGEAQLEVPRHDVHVDVEGEGDAQGGDRLLLGRRTERNQDVAGATVAGDGLEVAEVPDDREAVGTGTSSTRPIGVRPYSGWSMSAW